MDKEQELKRKKLYGSESYKEKFEPDFAESAESNNDIFSMVFLNKKKKEEEAQMRSSRMKPKPKLE